MTDDQPTKQHPIDDRLEGLARSNERTLAATSRDARVAEYDDMRIGVCIYLTVRDLRELGINLSQIESDVVEYTIDGETSRLVVRPAIGN